MRLLVLLLFAALGAGQQLPYKVDGRAVWAVKPSGATVVNTRLGGISVEISIRAWRWRSGSGEADSQDSYPECWDSPCSIMSDLHVLVGGKQLWVGPYQIAGLGDVHYLAVAGTPEHLTLIFMGHDAAEAYEAHLIFKDKHVVERILYAGIDLSHPFEVSHYFYETIN